jgi:HPt (histidine-containing phosphotransfer) domain-containing protein
MDEEQVLSQFDWPFICELLQDLLDEAPTQMEEMKRACDRNNHGLFSEVAHSIKGAALNLHLKRLATVAKFSEQAGKHLRLHLTEGKYFPPQLVRQWLDARDTCIQALQKEFATIQVFLDEVQGSLEQEMDQEYYDEDGYYEDGEGDYYVDDDQAY